MCVCSLARLLVCLFACVRVFVFVCFCVVVCLRVRCVGMSVSVLFCDVASVCYIVVLSCCCGVVPLLRCDVRLLLC